MRTRVRKKNEIVAPTTVAVSKRATARPRSPTSAADAIAMYPRMDGTLAAVEAPSRNRVTASNGTTAVRPVNTTATPPKTGPSSMTR